MITGILSLTSYEPDGMGIIKQALKKAEADEIIIKYSGGGNYKISVTAPDYKEAEKILKKSTESAIKFIEKNKGAAVFKRIED